MIKISQTTANAQAEIERAKAALGKLREHRDLGFLQITERPELWASCSERAKQVNGRLAVLGIGGSSLGGRALMDSAANEKVEFFENVDGRDFWDRLNEISLSDLEKTHWVVISKSGSTIETLGQTSFVCEFLESKKLTWKDRFTVVTEKKANPLHDWAKANGIPMLEVPLDVGGRFSVLSPVGMFPAAAAGFDIGGIRSGAEWALKQDDLIAQLAAQSLASWKRDEWITLFWAYSNRLWTSGLWIQQLWAESLAKKTDRKGKPAPRASTPIPLIGANDQHSMLQQVAEGARDKFIWFLRVKDAETAGPALKKSLFSTQTYLEGKKLGDLLAAEAQATAKALQQNQIQSLTLEIEKLDSRTMGAFFMLFELVVGTLGEALDINAFDQPGVELGKRLALDILK